MTYDVQRICLSKKDQMHEKDNFFIPMLNLSFQEFSHCSPSKVDYFSGVKSMEMNVLIQKR